MHDKTTIEKRRIDKSSPIPIYYQIASDLIDYLRENRYEINDKIPSEMTLSAMYDVSRVTVRQALNVIETEGYIKKIKGVGSILFRNPNSLVMKLAIPGLNNKNDPSYIEFTPRLLALEKIPAIPRINEALEMEWDKPLVHVKRVFEFNGEIVALVNSYLPYNLVPDFIEKGLVNTRISATLKKRYGFYPSSIDDTIEARNISVEDMNTLGITSYEPTLSVTAVSRLASGTPLEFSSTIWKGNKIKFHTRINKEDLSLQGSITQ